MHPFSRSVRPSPTLFSGIHAALDSPWLAYAALLVLQLKRIWRVWDWRDLPGGDTCAYFLCVPHGHNNFAFSPLYTSVWGLFFSATDDVGTATMAYRVIIILAAAALVLAVFREILPAAVAWLVAAWWVVLPVNFDTMYEVHLFSLLPLLLAWIALWHRRSAWYRGAALAWLVAGALLVRNEMIVGAAVFAVLCLVQEVRLRRRGDPVEVVGPVGSTIAAYLLPLALALAASAYFYADSSVRGLALRAQMHAKHIVSMGQAYALGYAERHPEWGKNPWADYEDACRVDFGTPGPTFSDMLRANPRAVASHALWNLRLLPRSIQLLLFNRISGGPNPDVVEQPTGSRLALIGSLGVLVLIALALGRRKSELWQALFRERRFEWAASVSILAFTIPVILLIRPRPAYLFAVSVLLMAFLGACAVVVVGRWRFWRRIGVIMPAVMLALIMLVPGAYGTSKHHGPQPLLTTYERLKPLQKAFLAKNAVYLGARAVELHNYLGFGTGRAIDLQQLTMLPANETVEAYTDREGVTLFYLDLAWFNIIEARRPGSLESFLGSASDEWRIVEAGQSKTDWWLVLARRSPANRDRPELPLQLR